MLEISGFALVQSCYVLISYDWWNSLCLCRWSGAQSQLVCSGCRNLLLYPVGATSVCCAVCNAVTAVPPPGMFSIYFGVYIISSVQFWVSIYIWTEQVNMENEHSVFACTTLCQALKWPSWYVEAATPCSCTFVVQPVYNVLVVTLWI